jgi:cysteine desulfurase/selenocysteine lyase
MPSPTNPEPPLPRSQFPVTERFCYLNHAGVSPLPVVAGDAIRAATDDFTNEGINAFDLWGDQQEDARAAAATLMGVPTDDGALVKNTTEGLGFVANGLSWQPGDRVIVPDLEFPSTIYPWLSLRELGVAVDLIEPVGPTGALPLELFEATLVANGGSTKVVAISWVQYAKGWRTDLAALADLCHHHGALLCVDAIQGLGVIPADFLAWNVDFATADAHKFVLGPLGIGVLYVAEHRRDLLRPLEPGWASVVHRDDYDNLELVYDTTARRFEGGSYNNITIAGMGASIDLLNATGIDRIWRYVDGLLDHATAALTEAGAVILSDRGDHCSAILCFGLPDLDIEIEDAWQRLDDRGFVCSLRGGGIRIAPHAYNTVYDIDALVTEVRALRSGRLPA